MENKLQTELDYSIRFSEKLGTLVLYFLGILYCCIEQTTGLLKDKEKKQKHWKKMLYLHKES